jgi:hypothetical protein
MRIIYDLCGGTGNWSRPYVEAGYDVRVIDLPTDIRLLPLPAEPVHGVLAAPPCTFFCRMRMCRGRPSDEQFREGLSVVDACLRFITMVQPAWWALENPQGYLWTWLGEPILKFHPWQFGDPWTKRTWLWGKFNLPQQNVVDPVGPLVNSRTGHPLGKKGLARNFTERAATPPGFARAFFRQSLTPANNSGMMTTSRGAKRSQSRPLASCK